MDQQQLHEEVPIPWGGALGGLSTSKVKPSRPMVGLVSVLGYSQAIGILPLTPHAVGNC